MFAKHDFEKYWSGLVNMKSPHSFILFLLWVAPAFGQSVDFRAEPANVVSEPGAFACELTFDLTEFQANSTAYANLVIPIEIGGEGYPSLNLWHVKEDGSRELATAMTPGSQAAIHLGLTEFLNPRLPLGRITFRLEQVAGSGGIISIPSTPPIMLKMSTDEQPRISLEDMLAPLWTSPRVYDESILPVSRDGGPASATLLFQPAGPVLVRNRELDKTYREGVDYTIDGQTLRLTPGSVIPSLSMEQLYPSSGGSGVVAGLGGTFILTQGVLERQLSVSYDRASEWDGPVPAGGEGRLPLTRGKLGRGEPVKIALLGDSISSGASASRASPPHVPGWGELFVRGLRQRFASSITFVNRSRGGGNSNWGQKVAPAFVVPEKPDLCIIAFGMNDANGTSTASFLKNIQAIMEQVRGGNPAVEFILVAPMLRNEKWRSLQPMDTYLDALKSLESASVAVADVWSISRHIARTKGPYETSDHINHPNDFIVRVYGQVALALFLSQFAGTTSPLTVLADGTLRLDNRPFTGIGVNYYSAFERVLDDANNTTYEAGFSALGRWGVPFARLDITGHWPSKANLFFTNRTEYFRRLDGVVASAERHGVGLIPTLFWTTFTFSDLAGEHLDQLAVSNSVTRQKMREFATAIVNRYKYSRAIWAWEFGNEWSLAVDLPNGTEFLPPTWTNLGNPATRDPVRDVLATDTILPAMLDIGRLIKELDPGRPLSTGHAMSRPSQWHQDQWKRGLLPIGSAWTTDSVAQAEEIALRQCPDPYDLLSVHIYENDPQRLPNFATFATRAGKALFVGEFGTAPADDGTYAAMLAAVRAHAPLAAVWVFDRSVDDFNIITTNARSWMLRDLLPASFTTWSRGWSANEVPGANSLSAGAQYIFGSPRPGAAAQRSTAGWSTNALWLEAVVRTNDPSWRILGQTSTTLSPGSWGTNGVSSVSSTSQSDVLPGCERRVFTVPPGTNTRKFLRISAESP